MKRKDIIALIVLIAVAALVSVGIILGVKLSSKNDRDKNIYPNKPIIGKITISIECKTILDNYESLEDGLKGSQFIPQDGIILKAKQFDLYEGDTVFDMLVRVTKIQSLHLDYVKTPAFNSMYIRGINHIYERSCGDLSGWMYLLNDGYPTGSSSNHTLKNDDTINWKYTCDLGKDIGAEGGESL